MERYYSTFLPRGPAGGRWRWPGEPGTEVEEGLVGGVTLCQ